MLGSSAFNPEGQRLLGLSLESGRPIFAPKGHSLLLSANGGGKTTRGAMPWLFSLIASEPDKAILVLDSKDAEIARQVVPMVAKMGRKVAVIDDMGTCPELAEYRVDLNPNGLAIAAHRRDARDVLLAKETISKTLIEQPKDDAKNRYFYEWPQNIADFGLGMMLKRNPMDATPGAVSALINDRDLLLSFARIEAEEGDGSLQDLGQAILDMQGHEHWPQHLEAAQRSLRLFSKDSRLHEAGRGATLTHEDLIREGYVIFLCGPQATMNRLGPYYALHILSFTTALYQRAGALRVIADEFTNTPLKALVESLTTLRAFGGEIHMIAQSRSEIIRRFGEQETRTIEDNAIVKQWFGFSSFEEAERVSKAIGEEHAVASGLSGDTDGLKSQESLSLNRQRVLSPSELMALPRQIQLVHIKGVGFFLARTIAQNEIAPYCHLVGDNLLEGGRLPPDPKIRLTTPKRTFGWRWK